VAANSEEKGVLIRVRGAFNVCSPSGKDLTPRGNKACALLAILFLSADRCRPRRWIESILWSTRSPEQSSTSLRQSLSEIRRSLGPYGQLLGSDRKNVWLNPKLVEECRSDDSRSNELLEGIAIRDPAFIEWLESMRSSDSVPSERLADDSGAAPLIVPGRSFVLTQIGDGALTDNMVGSLFLNQIAKNLQEAANVRVYDQSPNSAIMNGDQTFLSVDVNSWPKGRQLLLIVNLRNLATGELLLTKTELVDPGAIDPHRDLHLFQLAEEVSDCGLHYMKKPVNSSNASGNVDAIISRALQELFSFDAARLRIADRLLAAAIDIDPHPTLIAWRSYLRIPMWIERVENEPEILADEARVFAHEAVEIAPSNSQVLAIAAQSWLTVCKDGETALSLAEDAVQINPGGALTNMSYALALLRAGELDHAKQHADRSLALAKHSKHRHWWYMVSSAVDIANNQFDTAISKARKSHIYAPSYRPPLRHLYALYIQKEDFRSARAVLEKMRVVEPEFSMQTMRNDVSYPATTLRSTRLIELEDMVDPSSVSA